MMQFTTATGTNAAAASTIDHNSSSSNTGPETFVEKAARMPTLLDEDEDAWWMVGGTAGGAILEAPELGLLDHEEEMALRPKLSFELLPLATIEDSRMDTLFSLDPEERAAAIAKMAEEESKKKKDDFPSVLDLTPTTLQKRLDVMHRQLLEWIQQQPKDKQPRLHQMVRQWAEKLQSDLQQQQQQPLEEEGDKKLPAVAAAPSKMKDPPPSVPTNTTTTNTVATPTGMVPIKMESV